MRRTLLALPLLLLLAAGCRKDGGPSWDTGLVLPLAHASLSIDNMIADSLTTTNADGSVRFVYSTSFLDFSTDTLFDIPDTTIPNLYPNPFLSPLQLGPSSSFPIPPSAPTTYALGNVQLVSGILKTGTMLVTLRNDLRRRIVVEYRIPSATKNNVVFDTTFTVPAAPDSINHAFMYVTIDLSGYTIDFTGVNGNQVNTLNTQLSAIIDPTETTDPYFAYQGETVGAITTFTGIKPYYIRGYFGSETIDVGPEETGFTFFSRVLSGSLGLDSLRMSLHIDNYVGMDSRLTINSIWSRNTRTGQSVYLNHSIMGTPININRGSYSNSWPPVTPSTYDFVFDNSNSNAKALVENLPDKLGYDLRLETNPLGNVSGNNDFFFSDFGINAKLDVEMPLNFYADRLVIGDTIETDFASVQNKEDILKGTLTLYAQNSFPFSAGLQIYLLDATGNITDSIVALPNVIASGITGLSSNYTVSTGFTSSVLNIPLDVEQTQALLGSTHVFFKAIFDTNSAPAYVKVFNTNRLDLQLTADFDYHIGD